MLTTFQTKDREEHDYNLKAFRERCKDNGIKLNRDKLKLRMREVTFMRHVITKDGLQSDPEKVKDIAEMAAPTNINELRRYLGGVINYLAKCLTPYDRCHLSTEETDQ